MSYEKFGRDVKYLCQMSIFTFQKSRSKKPHINSFISKYSKEIKIWQSDRCKLGMKYD